MTNLTRREVLAALAAAACVAPPLSLARWDRSSVLRRRLGGTDLEVSVVGFGGMTIALNSSTPEHVSAILNRALDNGLNFIDTAECYGYPEKTHSESLIGAAIGARREEYCIASKVGHEHGAFAQEHSDWSRSSILRTIERSLHRLRTDHLDLVYLHGCSVETLQQGESIEALRDARRQGKIRYIGYSGGGERLRIAIGLDAFDVVQMTINIFEQQEIDSSLAEARRRNLGVVAKRPLGNAVWRFKEPPDWWYYREYWDLIEPLNYEFLTDERIADEGPEGAAGMALRFVTSAPGVHSAIVGTNSVGRWEQNSGNVAAGALSEARWGAIHERWRSVVNVR